MAEWVKNLVTGMPDNIDEFPGIVHFPGLVTDYENDYALPWEIDSSWLKTEAPGRYMYLFLEDDNCADAMAFTDEKVAFEFKMRFL